MWQKKSNGDIKWSLILFFIGKYIETASHRENY